MYTEKTTLGELIKLEVVKTLLEQIAPGMTSGPALDQIKGMTIEQLLINLPEKKHPMFRMLLDLANGKEVTYEPADPSIELPELEVDDRITYDIDDVDGSMYMLEHRFSGCLVVRFSKEMDESVYGVVTYDGRPLPTGLLKSIETAGGIQMCGIPVRDILTEYDTDYVLHIEGFRDSYGNLMKPQELTVHTLPKAAPDAAYQEHDAVALLAAEEGIVLLKNENHLLPLAGNEKICVRGAQVFRTAAVGAGRINPRYHIRFGRALEEYSEFCVTEEAEIGIVIISRPSGENFDNNAVPGEYYLSAEEEKEIKALCKQCNHVIAVINSGYPMDLRWTDTYPIEAVLWCGFPGMLGGKALVEILDGRVNPSGKLPDTWSLDYRDIPASANFYQPDKVEEALGADAPEYINTYYEEDIYVGYRYFETFDKAVMYPFGYGLSYTTFEIETEFKESTKDENASVLVRVKNTGEIPGKEVVQLYAAIPDGKLEQPVKRLIAFEKTKLLAPGECETITFPIETKQLESYEEETASWIMEVGNYYFYVGNSVKNLFPCGKMELKQTKVCRKVENRMRAPVEMDVLSKRKENFPKGEHSGIAAECEHLEPKAERKHMPAETFGEWADSSLRELVDQMSLWELARLSVCGYHGWGMHEKGEAGRIFQLENYEMPSYRVADGNNGVNIHRPNIGMPCSNTVCASWNKDLGYRIGQVIAEEAKENDIQMILAPAMNIHRNPLNGRHPEYFSEDPYLAGMMAGYQNKGLEEHGVSGSIKHVVGNNCESSRKRNQSIITERALREIYLKVFEVSMSVHQPDSMMTGYNAVNGCFTAEDEELIEGIFREEFGFRGFVMTDWNSYDTADVASAVRAGNCWMTPGTADDTYVVPIVEGVESGKIEPERLKDNVCRMLAVVEKRTGRKIRKKCK